MKKLNIASYTVKGFLLALVSSFSCSVSALIIEGTFSGSTWSYINENMHVTPDAKFFHEDENEYQPFTGTFWYDTDLSGPAYDLSRDLVIYEGEGEADWIHTTIVGANGASLDFKGWPNFSGHLDDYVYIERYDDGDTFYDSLTLSYGEAGPSPYLDGSDYFRMGGLRVASTTPILDGLSLVQNFERSSELNNNKPIGSIYFETRGEINGVSYRGDFWANLNHFEIHVREPASVPEPSSLLLFLLPLAFLFWRAGLLPMRLQA